MESRIDHLEHQLDTLRSDFEDLSEDLDHLVRRTLLLDESVLIRSLAVWGHYLLGQFLVAIPLAFMIALVLFLTIRIR
jgi:hypothetical protein